MFATARPSTHLFVRMTAALPLLSWLRVARERRALRRLDARALTDLGIDARAAARESARSFWDMPAGR